MMIACSLHLYMNGESDPVLIGFDVNRGNENSNDRLRS